MSRPTPRALAASLGALLVLALACGPAGAHGDRPVLQLSHDTIQPGATITVHAQGMDPDEEIAIELGDATQALPLGTAIASGDGTVDATLEIPWQTPKGPWRVYARGRDGGVVSAPLTLAGVAINPADGEGDPPDEEDPFIGLEPSPSAGESAAPAAVATSSASAAGALPNATFRPRTLPPQPREGEAPGVRQGDVSPGDAAALWLVAAGGGVGCVALTGLVLRRRRTPSA